MASEQFVGDFVVTGPSSLLHCVLFSFVKVAVVKDFRIVQLLLLGWGLHRWMIMCKIDLAAIILKEVLDLAVVLDNL